MNTDLDYLYERLAEIRRRIQHDHYRDREGISDCPALSMPPGDCECGAAASNQLIEELLAEVLRLRAVISMTMGDVGHLYRIVPASSAFTEGVGLVRVDTPEQVFHRLATHGIPKEMIKSVTADGIVRDMYTVTISAKCAADEKLIRWAFDRLRREDRQVTPHQPPAS